MTAKNEGPGGCVPWEEQQRLRRALELIHDWAAVGGEMGEHPDRDIMRLSRGVLDQPGVDPDTWA